MEHQKFMQVAYEEAKIAYAKGEVPVGAVIVRNGEILAKAHNLRESLQRASAHAEILAIDEASTHLKTWNLSECTLYVTVEPCQMCTGAVMQAHLGTIVYGAKEPNSGSIESILKIKEIVGYNHYPYIVNGIMEEESKELMVNFFKDRREETVKVKRITEETFAAYLEVRKEVFVKEQNVDLSLEIDEYDVLDNENVVHIGAFYKGDVVGTARYFKNNDTMKIGRVAVLKSHRHLKVGSKLMAYTETQARNNGFKRMELGAQVSAVPFYEHNGYAKYGDIFLDADIDHIMMEKLI
ncbi:GNAT family N-acetyltransferase [Erysipelothrix sp. HDW6C]|uniref:GNAT family N-acetyltransferase n=1 Tax=Erysipelothrix sp. HDW6C TaxID=2714930 RepID=UPI00140747B8|nr:GNAT family N-acetyltransferase [Erysipelothrix sp. HDW6C]QIK69088.1 GNAT family N-acetyltransferase [Erysipelothrix sp. HDW6C]